MSDIRAKVAYLHGLAEGLDIDTSSAEGRVIASIIDVLGDMADEMEDIAEAQVELADYVEDVDHDLGALEESVYEVDEYEYADEDDDDEETVYFVPEENVHSVEDGVELLACPECGEILASGAGELAVNVEAVCPNCGCTMCTVDDDDLVLEHD